PPPVAAATARPPVRRLLRLNRHPAYRPSPSHGERRTAGRPAGPLAATARVRMNRGPGGGYWHRGPPAGIVPVARARRGPSTLERMMRVPTVALLLLAACMSTPAPAAMPQAPAGSPADSGAADSLAVVRPGIEVFLDDVPQRLRGKRVGLITNHTGIDR